MVVYSSKIGWLKLLTTATIFFLTLTHAQTQAEYDLAQATLEITAWPAACLVITSGTPTSGLAIDAFDKDNSSSFAAIS